MSGIVGILHLDGAPVDAPLLQRLTDALAFRGPDAQRIWTNGPVGFGHAMLRATAEAESECQPACLETRFWIAADARIDDRGGLIGKLQAAGRSCSNKSTDAELILHSYAVWGDRCVEYLLGDFAFLIWDAERNRLFCARDHFGVKSFYYARTGNLLILSNTLDCLRLHPEISQKLNDAAVVDFLLFDFNCDLGVTAFADILRLPPAHILECEHKDVSVHPYWTLPAPEEIRYKRPGEYIEHFDELLSVAVEDRLRVDTPSVLMSGGLDSSTVAAYAQQVLRRAGKTIALHAYTEVFDRLFPHEERHYAGLVAEALRIPIHYRSADAMTLYDVFDEPRFNWPEPVHCPWGTTTIHQLREIALRSRVALTGLGADPGLSSSLSWHFRALLHRKRFGQALSDLLSYLAAERRFSRLYLRTRWRLLFSPEGEHAFFPPWLNEDVEKDLRLRDRWKTFDRETAGNLAVRPGAYHSLVAPYWPSQFEWHDPGVTRVPVEVRHPFFDLRVVNFLLALPALPWCSDKELLRYAAQDVLPAEVRLRRKSPLMADPLVVLLQNPESAWVDEFEASPGLDRYVVRSRVPRVLGERDVWRAWIHLRPLSLNFWLHRN